MLNGRLFRAVMAIDDSVFEELNFVFVAHFLLAVCAFWSVSMSLLFFHPSVDPFVRSFCSFAHLFFVIDFNVNVVLVLFLHYYQ